MREDNIFKVGDIVEGESLIGYEKFYQKLRRDILVNRGNLALVGLHRMGKTSLMKKLHKEVKHSVPSMIPIFINIQEFVDEEDKFAFDSLLLYIANEIKDGLFRRRAPNQCDDFCCVFDKFKKTPFGRNFFRHYFKALFEEIKSLDMHVLLSLDEFDAAEKIFKTNADFELFRSLASPDFAVSLVFISRRRLYMIEKKNENNSTFHGSFPESPLTGFSDDDVKLFFKTLERNYEISLPLDQIERIKYYAGCSPYIYSAFCHKIVEEKISGQKNFDADEIYKLVVSTVTDYANVLYDRLRTDGHLSKILGILFGPSLNVTQSDKDLLFFMGYLSDEPDGEDHYQALSSYFTDALHNKYSPDDSWKNIIDVEKLMKSLVTDAFPTLDNDLMTQAYSKIFGNEKKFNYSLYKNFISNNLKVFDRNTTLIEVLSLSDTFVIIQFRWDDLFKKFFECKAFAVYKEKFELCAKARNPLAHGHPEYLSKFQQDQVNVYCSEILEIVQKCQQKLKSDAVAPFVVPEEKITPLPASVSRDNIGKVGTLTDIICKKSGGIKGKIFGSVGTVAKKSLTENIDYSGQSLRVKVTDLNPQCTGYLLEPVNDN